jgi:glucosylceramidase
MPKNNNKFGKFKAIGLLFLPFLLLTCQKQTTDTMMNSYKLKQTEKIIVTSETGDKLTEKANVTFQKGKADGKVKIDVFPEKIKQTMDGIGSSFTESSAFVLAHLEKEQRLALMQEIWGENGANFSLARTHIGACDFSVEGKYSYTDVKDDVNLKHFSIAEDKIGFSKSEYPHIVDEKYDLLPMIQEALAIKAEQKQNELRIIASAWTAPSWMKDIEEWYIPGSPENNWQGTGGSLKPEYVPLYAKYLVKYLEAYHKAGVPIWGLTPVNEPHGNNGQWESMHFSPQSQNEFVQEHLGPALKRSPFADTRLLIYDQNRDGLEEWTDVIFGDEKTAPYVYGAAVHWYESTEKVYGEVFDRVKEKFPDKAILHTEGCIDDLGKDAPNGIADPVKFKETNWFDNDAFWWNPNATDWAYSATWQGVNSEAHPAYTPVHRYARNIIVSIDHWLQGWIDWNIILDEKGGPNHVGNFCGAPIMIDTKSKKIYRTPIFHVLAQFSRTIRPGDRAVETRQQKEMLPPDALHACATINEKDLLSVQLLNTTKSPISYHLQIGGQFAEITIPANAVQTVQVQLNHQLANAADLEKETQREKPFKLRPFYPGEKTQAISYGPYRKGQAPGVKGPSEAQILEDLNILKAHWELIRIYGADADAKRILQVIEDYQLPIRVMQGVWLENETNNPEKKAANKEQVENAIILANRYPQIIAGITVGNESQVFWSWHRMDMQDLIRHIRTVRHFTKAPVSTADDFNFWNKPESKAVADEIDFIVTHIYPLWNGKTLKNAITWLDSTYRLDVKKMHPNKHIVLGEIGWATRYDPTKKGDGQQGTLIKGKVGYEAQTQFLKELTAWSEKNKMTTFYFEAFDEPWKGGGEASGPDEVEKHWGLYYENRLPKPSFSSFLENSSLSGKK